MSLKELLVSHLSCTVVTSGAETRALLEILMKPSFNKYLLPPLKPPVLKPATLKPLTLKPPTLKPSSKQQISFAAIDILLKRLIVDTMPIIMTPAQWRRRRGSSRQSECIPHPTPRIALFVRSSVRWSPKSTASYIHTPPQIHASSGS